jgi:hypothetical protein
MFTRSILAYVASILLACTASAQQRTPAQASPALSLGAAGLPVPPHAAMYTDALLQSKMPQYESVIRNNLDDTFLPKLPLGDRRALGAIQLEMPLRGRTLLDFYSYAPGRVALPAMSIRFLADLSLAYAWLGRNGYAIEAVADYVSMLKYQTAGQWHGRYLDPRQALHIPANATQDRHVNRAYEGILNEAISFIVLHEVGHRRYQHPGNDHVPGAVSRANEEEADGFALEVLRQNSLPPLGALFFFLSVAHFESNRADYATAQDYQDYLDRMTHPLTAARVRRIARYIDANADDFARPDPDPRQAAALYRSSAAEVSEKVVKVLEDPAQQLLMAARGLTLSVDDLAPRRPDEALARGPSRTSSGPFDGVFDGTLGKAGDRIAVRVILYQNGDLVRGRYATGVGHGSIEGRVSKEQVQFQWHAAQLQGHGVIARDAAGKLQGTWGLRDETSGFADLSLEPAR